VKDMLEQTLAQLDELREAALADEQRALSEAAEARRRRVQYDAALRALGVGEKKQPKSKPTRGRKDGQPSISTEKLRAVRDAIWATPHGATQRDLIEATGLGQGSVSTGVRRLVAADEIRVIGTRPSTNGRMQIDVYGLMERQYPNGNSNGGR
jgi:CRP-like cAMP-binding protein